MKKAFFSSFVLVLSLMLLLVGCGGGDSKKDEGEKSGGKTEAKFTFKLSGAYPTEHPNTKAMEKFAQIVEEKTNGEIQFDIFPAAQLGDYTVIYEEIMKGTIEMGFTSLPTNYDERLSINWINYLAESYDVAKEVFAPGSFFYQTNEKLLEEAGVKYLGFHVEGLGGIGTVDPLKNITKPGADKGILLRVPPIDIYKEAMEDLGFRTVSIPYAELYQALQTGVADGWAGGPPVANYHDVSDVIKHYYQFNDYFEMVPIIMNMKKWEEIGEENQKIIQEAAHQIMMESFERAEKDDKEYMEKMKEKGIEIVTFSDEELKAFADHVRKTTWPKLKDKLGEEIYNGLIQSYE